MIQAPSRSTAILLAIFITVLWSSSWILIKMGLRSELPPITFAGLRYTLAFLCVAPFVLAKSVYRREIHNLRPRDWMQLVLLGVLLYTITQTAQYASLLHLTAAMLSLILNLGSLFVAISGVFILHETPSPRQWVGVLLTVLGAGLFFLPVSISASQWIGLLFALICLAGNVFASLFGRHVNRSGSYSPIVVTVISMGVGSILMLLIGLITQGTGDLSTRDWLIIAWLAVVNTAFAFTIWNTTLQTLTAMESSIINNLMMPQIALLAWIFLGERLVVKEILGILLVAGGVLLVQLSSARHPAVTPVPSESSV